MHSPFHSLPWRVLYTRSRSEKKTASLIQSLGVSVYLPLQATRKRWSDRVKTVEEPLFPGYLFVQFTEEQRYPLLQVPGAVRIVSFGGTAATIPTPQIEALQKLAYLDNEIQVVDTALTAGQEVLIQSGPFKGLEGQLIRHNGKGRLLIEIKAIGKGVLLDIGRTRLVQLPDCVQS